MSDPTMIIYDEASEVTEEAWNSVLTLDKIREIKNMLEEKPEPVYAGWNGDIIENVHLTIPEYVNRAWKERLFSWPWHPFRKQKVIHVPDPNCYFMEVPNIAFVDFNRVHKRKVLTAHPYTANILRQGIRKGLKDVDV